MRIITKTPVFSFVLSICGYAVLGWLFAIHGASWQVWLTSGAIAFGLDWVISVIWAIAAVYFVFARAEALVLSIGVCLIWALLTYIARLEIQANSEKRWQAFLVLSTIAAASMYVGWFADSNLIPNIGKSLIKQRL